MNEEVPRDRLLTPEEAAKLRARATKVVRKHLRAERRIVTRLKPKPEPPKPS